MERLDNLLKSASPAVRATAIAHQNNIAVHGNKGEEALATAEKLGQAIINDRVVEDDVMSKVVKAASEDLNRRMGF